MSTERRLFVAVVGSDGQYVEDMTAIVRGLGYDAAGFNSETRVADVAASEHPDVILTGTPVSADGSDVLAVPDGVDGTRLVVMYASHETPALPANALSLRMPFDLDDLEAVLARAAHGPHAG